LIRRVGARKEILISFTYGLAVEDWPLLDSLNACVVLNLRTHEGLLHVRRTRHHPWRRPIERVITRFDFSGVLYKNFVLKLVQRVVSVLQVKCLLLLRPRATVPVDETSISYFIQDFRVKVFMTSRRFDAVDLP